jgi:hypothetical protein
MEMHPKFESIGESAAMYLLKQNTFQVIRFHQQGKYALAQTKYVEVMNEICEADGHTSDFVDLVMLLMEYRVPGRIPRTIVERIMSEGNPTLRRDGFNMFLRTVDA